MSAETAKMPCSFGPQGKQFEADLVHANTGACKHCGWAKPDHFDHALRLRLGKADDSNPLERPQVKKNKKNEVCRSYALDLDDPYDNCDNCGHPKGDH